MKVGFIGLGAMGVGMARHVAQAGYLTAVYNRTTNKAERLAAELNVAVYYALADLAKAVDVVLLCVSADSDVLAIIEALAPHLRAGAIVVDMSTVSATTAQQAAQLLAKYQVDFLDAPVSGGVEGATNGSLAIMVGGNAQVLANVQPVLESMSSRLLHMGSTGCGQASKAVNQMLCAGINQAVTEALAFAELQALPLDKVIAALSAGAAGNWFLAHRGASMTAGQFATGFKLRLHHKDLKICQQMAAPLHFTAPLVDMTVTAYEQLMAQGFGDEDISALYRLKRN